MELRFDQRTGVPDGGLSVTRHFGYSHDAVERVSLLAWLDALAERLVGPDEERP
jgi:hypothetical protein